MNIHRLVIGTASLSVAVATALHPGTASAIGNCGGQSAPPQPVPYQCALPGIDITYQGVTRHFSAVVTANGQTVTVTYLMTGGKLPVDVPIRIVHHEGISGAGGASNESSGVIPAGATTATLTDSAPCRSGQLDVKAVDISNGSGDRFRVGGPWIQNGTGCTETTTTIVTTTTGATTSTVVTTTVPGTSPTSGPSVGSSVPGTSPATLPPTGMSTGASFLQLALAVLGLGALILFLVKFLRWLEQDKQLPPPVS